MDSTRESNPCRNRPLARSARRYKGVIGESKEGIGGTRNPPCPPWPPEAPKIEGKRTDNHLIKPNAVKNRKIDPRRIQERIERTLKDPPRKNILSPTLHVPQLSPHQNQKTPALYKRSAGIKKPRRRPILPGGCPPSTFGAMRLNFCVRYGNRWYPHAIVTGKTVFCLALLTAAA